MFILQANLSITYAKLAAVLKAKWNEFEAERKNWEEGKHEDQEEEVEVDGKEGDMESEAEVKDSDPENRESEAENEANQDSEPGDKISSSVKN